MSTFKQIWEAMTAEEKQCLADQVSTSKPYLSQIAHGHSEAGRKMIRKLMSADGRIRAEMFL